MSKTQVLKERTRFLFFFFLESKTLYPSNDDIVGGEKKASVVLFKVTDLRGGGKDA